MSQQSEKTPSDGNRNEDEDFLDDRDDDSDETNINE